MRAAHPEDDGEEDHNGGDGEDSPGDFARVVGEIALPRANVFVAGKLQMREFLDWGRGLRV